MFHREGPTFLELMRQALSSTDEGYDLLAPKFDHTPFRTPDALLDEMAPLLASEPVASALDVCCGTGAATRVLAGLGAKSVVGVDRSAGMLREARRRLPDGRVRFVRGDVLELPFAGERFDLAVSFGAFGHILERDQARLVRGVHRVLAPGGRFAFATTTMPPLSSASYWAARGFNAVMRARNALKKPEFVMYYLTFLWPGVRALLEEAGFVVEARPLGVALASLSPEQRAVWAVVARKPAPKS